MFEGFIRGVEENGYPVRGVVIKRGGDTIFEKQWEEDKPHNIYSHTKSFTATAIGMLVSDGRIKTSDRIVDLLPEITEYMQDGFEEVRIRDALTMSSGIDEPLLMMAQRSKGIGAPDYLAYVAGHPLKHKPGSKFLYSNGDTYLCVRVVEKVTGMTMRDFLNERLFKLVDIKYPEWEHCPMGHTFGASGLCLTLADMMKLGELYLGRGSFNGRQLLDPSWVKLASSRHIETGDDYPWNSGYGFQFWMCPYPDAYRADGAYGQFSIVLPHIDTVIGVQCDDNDYTRKIVDLIGTELVEPML